ncbi:MAG: extracellular solute-binding protein [Anaerolineae bacterium]|nr:extracellular solute-binding protein [Anaerolineae bacterium]
MNIRSKRIILLMLCAALVMLAVLPTSSTATAAQDKIVIKQWYHQYGEAGTQDAVMRYAEEYMKLNPNVTIEVTWIPGDYGARLNTGLAVPDEAPDVYETQVNRDAAAAGLYADLSDLYTDELKADFGPAHMAQVSIAGVPYGFKMIDDTGVIYYLKSQFEAAGIEEPTTFDELLAAATKLKNDDQAGLFIGNGGTFGAVQLLQSTGATRIKDGKLNFDSSNLVRAFSKMKELYDSGVLLTGAPTDWWDPSVFIDGLAAMQYGGLWSMPAILEAYGEDVGVFPIPAVDAEGAPSAWIGGWTQVVNPKSPNLEAAKAYVKWLWVDNTEIQTDWALGYGFHVPPRASVAAGAEPLKSGPALEVVEALQKYGYPEGDELWNGVMNTALEDALTAVVKNGADPQAEADKAIAVIQKELDSLTK